MNRLADTGTVLIVVAALLAFQALVLHLMGQPWVSMTHSIMLWAGDVRSVENSQQLSDWYSFSHIVHGFIFYGLLRYFFPCMSVFQRLLFAVGIEAAWEITENTPMVIQHYREQALAQGYVGDSVINSVSDTCMMIVGFIFAWRAPVWATISVAVFLELWAGFWIHDNLTLNVINLIHPFEFISKWQSGG